MGLSDGRVLRLVASPAPSALVTESTDCDGGTCYVASRGVGASLEPMVFVMRIMNSFVKVNVCENLVHLRRRHKNTF